MFVSIVIVLLIQVGGLIRLIRDSSDLADRNKGTENRYLVELEGKVGFSKGDIRYFTTGHPYVWGKIE